MTDLNLPMDVIQPEPPQPLISDQLDQPAPYPLDALPPLMREAAKAISQYAKAPVEIAAMCLINAVTSTAQTRTNAYSTMSTEGQPCSLFTLVEGESGIGKSACRKQAFKVTDEVEAKRGVEYWAEFKRWSEDTESLSGKELKDYIASNPRPINPQRYFGDTTLEPVASTLIHHVPAVVWDSDEAGQCFGGHTMKGDTRTGAMGTLTKLFDEGYIERNRAKSNLEGSGRAWHRRFSMALMGQRETIADSLNDPILRGQGLLPRFLFCAPMSKAGSRFITKEDLRIKPEDDSRLKQFWDRHRELEGKPEHIDPMSLEVHPPVLELDDEALDVWIDFRNGIEAEQGKYGTYANMRPFAARAGQLALRLSAVLSFFEGLDTVDPRAMGNACRLVEHSLGEWLRYMEGASVPQGLKNASDVWEWLTDPCRVNDWLEFDIRRFGKSGPNAFRKAKSRDPVLLTLLKHRYLSSSDSKLYKLNVAAFAAFAANEEIRGLQLAAELRHGCGTNENPDPQPKSERAKSANAASAPQPVPQPQTRINTGVPQMPQMPQAPEIEKIQTKPVPTPAQAQMDDEGELI